SDSADEALWWRDLFQMIARLKGLPTSAIRCMALVESHPLAFQMEEFAWNLRDHIVGLNLGRWDYMASLIHFNLENPEWVLPDRNTIPHNVAFFQNLRNLLPEICHKHGMLAIGGMTALFPSREDPELNARALKALAEDKKNEANSLMDGAWTGHPDQNEIAVSQFPAPNQLQARPANAGTHPDLRPIPTGVGKRTLAGTRAAGDHPPPTPRHLRINDPPRGVQSGVMDSVQWHSSVCPRMKESFLPPVVFVHLTAATIPPARSDARAPPPRTVFGPIVRTHN